MNNPALPGPDAAARKHSNRLVALIRADIESNGGSIGFDRFMELALYEPGLGYYSAGAEKIGAGGDYVTAPHISVAFSRCLAEQCRQVIETLDDAVILETGAGTGVMARDILLSLERQDSLPEHYYILETSADLRQRQQQLFEGTATHLLSRVHWLDRLPDAPLTGIMLANEVLDAIPVRRVCINDDAVEECRVGLAGNDFCWQDRAADDVLAGQVRSLTATLPDPLPCGYRTEVNLHLGPWLETMASCLHRGIMLLVDYGYTRREYYHPQRATGTLLCHYRHVAHADPFFFPGLQDITASVDFTAVADYAVAAGLDVKGFTTQVGFLIGCGLDRIVAELSAGDDAISPGLAAGVKQLTLPAEMGERCKVIALGRDFTGDLCGFDFNNQLQRL